MGSLREFGKRILPERSIEWYRRWRAVWLYQRSMGFELVDLARMELEDMEGRLAARRAGFYEGLLKDILDRTDLVLQELDRRIEGIEVRHGRDLRHLEDEVRALRADVERLLPGGGTEAGSARSSGGSVAGGETTGGEAAGGAAGNGQADAAADAHPATG